jgi:hypothetical protein
MLFSKLTYVIVSVTLFTAVCLCTINTSSSSSCKPCTFYCTWFSFLHFNLSGNLPTFLNSVTLEQLIVFLCGISSHILVCSHVFFINFSFRLCLSSYFRNILMSLGPSFFYMSPCTALSFRTPVEILPIQSCLEVAHTVLCVSHTHTHIHCVCISLCGI